jgi:hypothetical protein
MSLEIQQGRGGEWGVGSDADRGLVVLRFKSAGADGPNVFSCELTPAVAMQIAQSLVQHAMRAGHDGRPVSLTFGEPTQ